MARTQPIDALLISQYQRSEIVRLFAKNELPTRKFCLMHRIPFAAARLPDPPVDRPIDPHLQALTFAQASALIVALRRQAGLPDGDGDDDDDD
jgi:hypothetical protein